MAKLTHLATTITARYYSASDLTDAFYLDGRFSGKRESRSADITVDKEDRGFFFSVFSSANVPGRDPTAEPSYTLPLRKLYNEIKTGRKALDDQIGDLVNSAVAVTGRMKLQSENARAPFFAGVIVKDTEAFAITMGKGLAFLYRDDTIFPLTSTDIHIDPVNTQKQKVDNFYNYCADKTATALCSNIAQLKMDDCVILCNREVYDSLGQHEILRILFESEDQCEAAGSIITEASAKMPGIPMQCVISFVEGVTSQEKQGLFGFGKKSRQQSYNAAEDDAIEVPIASAPVTPTVPPVAASVVPPAVEPLFFGNEASNPFVMPLAEQTASEEVSSSDPIHFEDQSLEPFGEPEEKTVSSTDAGGFVQVDETTASAVPQVSAEAEFIIPAQSDIPMTQGEAASFPYTAQTSADSQPDFFSAKQASTYIDNAPQYLPDDADTVQKPPLVFGDDNVQPSLSEAGQTGYPAYEQNFTSPAPTPAPEVASSFFIPFESAEAPVPVKSAANDMPDMPIYDAPTYAPPTYPTNSYTPNGYDNAGVYARGSYTLDEEDADVRSDFPPAPKAPSQSYSYTPPSSYAAATGGAPRDPRVSQNQPRQSPPSAHRNGSGPSQRQNQPKDIFEQEQGFDYGATDDAYKKGRLLMIGLGLACLACVIILISVAAKQCSKDDTAKATTAPTNASVNVSTSDATAGVSATPAASDATSPATDPTPATVSTADAICIFQFTAGTGHRTWWDLFHTVYNISLDSNTDPRIAIIVAYNGKAADYVPAAGDQIYCPPQELLTTSTT